MNLLGSIKESNFPQTINFKVNCLVYVDDAFIVNRFKIKVGFSRTVENPILNDIALDQIELFFSLLMDNCVIISKDAYDAMEHHPKNNFLMTYKKPDDQAIACMLLYKLVNIVGNNLEIEYISLSSILGDKIKYTMTRSSEEVKMVLPNKENWWNDKNIDFSPWWLRNDSATYDRLINRDEIYDGEFTWDDMFEEQIKAAAEFDLPKSAKGFKVINGGKDAD
jgi:hypothetical protein